MSKIGKSIVYELSATNNADMSAPQVKAYASAFASTLNELKHATLFIHHQLDGIKNYLIIPQAKIAPNMALNLANANNAIETKIDDNPLLDLELNDKIVRLKFDKKGAPARDNMLEFDPLAFKKSLHNSLPVGYWVAINLRARVLNEQTKYISWFRSWLVGTTVNSGIVPTHHSMQSDAIVADFYAGGQDLQIAKTVLHSLGSALPGFDMPIKVVSYLPPYFRALTLSIPALIIWAFWQTPLLYLGVILGIISIGIVYDLVDKTRYKPLYSAYHFPKFNFIPSTIGGQSKTGVDDKSGKIKVGEYPLDKYSFIVSPSTIINTVLPYGSGIITKNTEVNHLLTLNIGAWIGNNQGKKIHIPYLGKLRTGGVAVLGSPGTGKSVLLSSLWGFNLIQKSKTLTNPDFNFNSNALIKIESKDVATFNTHLQWANKVDEKVVFIDLLNSNSIALEMLPKDLKSSEKGKLFANAIKYAFADQAAGETVFEARSVPTTSLVIALSDLVDEQVLELAQIPLSSFVTYAHILLGGKGYDSAINLYSSIKSIHLENEIVKDAKELFELNKNTFNARVESSLNRISQLQLLEDFFDLKRKKVSFEYIFEKGLNVYINTATSQNGKIVPGDLSAKFSALIMFLMQQEIKRKCSGYQSKDKYITVFSDELSEIAGSSAEVLNWIHDEGRSYGICPVFATQRPNQLNKRVKEMFLDFNTLIVFRQNNLIVANEICNYLPNTTPEDILNLDVEKYACLLKTSVPGTLPVTLVNIAGHEYNMDEYIVSGGL